MHEIVQEIKNLSIGFTSKKGEQISILKNINTVINRCIIYPALNF